MTMPTLLSHGRSFPSMIALALTWVLTSIAAGQGMGIPGLDSSPVAADDADPSVVMRLASETPVVEPGKPFRVALHFTIEPEWYLYWKNPGDSGTPPFLDWRLPEGFAVTDIQWPTPHRFAGEGADSLVSYGYKKAFALIATIQPPDDIKAGKLDLAVNVDYLICRTVCLHGSGQARLRLSMMARGEAEAAASASPLAHHAQQQILVRKWLEAVPAPAREAMTGEDAAIQRIEVKPDPAGGQVTVTVFWASEQAAPDQRRTEWFPGPHDGLTLGHHPEIREERDRTLIRMPVSPFAGRDLPDSLRCVLAWRDDRASSGARVDPRRSIEIDVPLR